MASDQQETVPDDKTRCGDVEEDCIEMAGLGRQFQLGQLYDAQNDNILSGRILWDQKQIEDATNAQYQLQPDYHFKNFNSKFEIFDITTNLKLNILIGTVKPKGAAQFVNDNEPENKDTPVLHHEFLNNSQQIIFDKLQQIQYQQALQDTNATHVVTKIEFGTDTIFVFESQKQDPKNFQIHDFWNKILMTVGQDSSKFVRLNDIWDMCNTNELKFINNFKCQIFSDLPMRGYQSFEVVLNFFRKLPELADKNQNSVRKVVLTPISKIVQYCSVKNMCQNISPPISSKIVEEVEKLMLGYTKLISECDLLMQEPLVMKYTRLQKQVDQLITITKSLQKQFQEDLRQTVSQIRRSNVQVIQLQKLLSASPLTNLSIYLTHFNKQLKKTQNLLQFLLPILCNQENLKEFKLEYEYVVCLEIGIPSNDQNLLQYLQENGFKQDGFVDMIQERSWYADNEVLEDINSLIHRFTQSKNQQDYNNCNNIQYAVVDLHENSKTEEPASISVYLKSKKIPTGTFFPPQGFQSTNDINNTKVELHWQHAEPKPDFYIINYYSKQDPQHKKENKAEKKLSGEINTVTVNNLIEDLVYFFSIRSQYDQEFSQVSEEIKVTPFPGQPRDLKQGKVTENSIELMWEAPEIGSQIVQNYVVEYREFGLTDIFMKKQSTDTWVQLSELSPDTIYLCRVKSVCWSGERAYSQITAKTRSEFVIANTNLKIQLKFVMIGESNSGKTFILKKIFDKNFYGAVGPTIAADIVEHKMKIDNIELKLKIWDTAGTEYYRAFAKQYVRNAVGILLVYDVTQRRSFDQLPFWLDQAREYSRQNAVVILVGNKIDKQESREVSTMQGTRFADENNLLFVEVSAMQGILISDLYDLLLHAVIRKIKTGHLEADTCTDTICLYECQPSGYNRKLQPGGWCASS